MSDHLHPCIFFDRDGIVNPCPGAGYVERPQDFHPHPSFIGALKTVRDKGYKAVLITNQRGVGKGIMTQKALDAIHAKMIRLLDDESLQFDGMYTYTGREPEHPRKKPNPGMLFEAAEDLGLDLTSSWMIGDRETDVQAGRAAGCRTVLVSGSASSSEATYILETVHDLPEFLEQNLLEHHSPSS